MSAGATFTVHDDPANIAKPDSPKLSWLTARKKRSCLGGGSGIYFIHTLGGIPTEKENMADKVIKMSVNLSADVVEALKELAEKRNTTMTEVLRQAIGTEKFIDEVN